MPPCPQIASIQRGSTTAISPTNPRSYPLVFFFRARNIMPSPPHNPTAGCPAAPRAATRLLFTMPASTIRATSRVSASVTRKPLMKALFFPRSCRVRVRAGPPPCTTARR